MSINKVYLIFLLFFFLALYLFFKDGLVIWQKLSGIEFHLLCYALLVNIFCVSLDFLNWMFYLKKLLLEKYHYSIKKYLSIHLAGFSIDLLPAKVGTFSRAILLKHLCNIPKRRGFAIQASALITDLLAAIIISALTTLIVIDFPLKQRLIILLLASIAIMTIIFVFNYKRKQIAGRTIKHSASLLTSLFSRLFSSLLKASHQESLNDAKSDFLKLFRLQNLRLTLTVKLVSWSLLGLSFYLVLSAFGYNINISQTILAVSVSAIVGGLSMLPGGVGTTDLSLFGFTMLWGIPADVAVLIVFSYRLISFWYLLLVGNIFSQYLLLNHNRQLDSNKHSI